MKAITLYQPMAWAIVAKHPKRKTIENRPRPLPRRMQGVMTTVALHAGLTFNDEHAEIVLRVMGIEKLPEAAWTRGAIIGVMTLDGTSHTTPPSERRAAEWFSGPFGYGISEAQAIIPIEDVRGYQGWWNLAPHIADQVAMRMYTVGFQPKGNWQ